MKTKICGLKSLCEIGIVNKYPPDYVGFVFAGVKRKIEEELALLLRRELSREIPAVGVFVNESIEKITKVCEQKTIQLVQLHGDEDRDYIHALKSMVGVPIIKAIRVQSKAQILEALTLPCDYFLFDSYSRDSYGGEGRSFDQAILLDVYKESAENQEIKKCLEKPYFIAGGLTAQNVRFIDPKLKPYGVDVSSGVESMGLKDENKIRNFINAVSNIGLQ